MYKSVFLVLVATSLVCAQGKGKGKGKGAQKLTFSSGEQLRGQGKDAAALEIGKMAKEVGGKGKGKSTQTPKGNQLAFFAQFEEKGGRGQHTRMEQFYQGIRVFGQHVISHATVEGEVEVKDKETGEVTETVTVEASESFSGSFIDGIADSTGDIDAEAIKGKSDEIWEQAKGKSKGRGSAPKREQSEGHPEGAEAIIYYDEATDTTYIAYLVKIFTNTEEDGPKYVNQIVTEDGAVLKEWDDLQTRSARQKRQEVSNTGTGPGGNEKIGKVQYTDMSVKDTSGTCTLENADVVTTNLDHGSSYASNTPHSFTCSENTVKEINGAYSPLNDAHVFAQKTFDMFREWYDVSPLKTPPMRMKVHFYNSYSNAFYTGTEMVFGDGGSTLHPLVSLDIVGHEIGHGVVQESSGLIYSGQSGGLNEAFADMMGKAVERYVRGYSGITWNVGGDIFKLNGGTLRDMSDPPADTRSIDKAQSYIDGMDVHHSSGVFNKVFWKLSTVLAYNVWDAFDIFYYACTRYWGPSNDFKTAAALTLKALDWMKTPGNTQWSYSWIDPAVVNAAFADVGITCTKTGTEWACTV